MATCFYQNWYIARCNSHTRAGWSIMSMSDYKIIEGLPADVEADVIRYRSEGWQRNGELFHRTVDGNNIAVQGICRDAPDAEKSIYVYNVYTEQQFDPKSMLNVVYHKILQPAPRSPFRYMIKIISYSQEDAEAQILREIKLQLHPLRRTGNFEFIQMEAYYV